MFWNSHWPLSYALECWLLFEIEGRWVCLRYKGISFNFWLINSPETRFERLPMFLCPFVSKGASLLSITKKLDSYTCGMGYVLFIVFPLWVMCCLFCFGYCTILLFFVLNALYCFSYWFSCFLHFCGTNLISLKRDWCPSWKVIVAFCIPFQNKKENRRNMEDFVIFFSTNLV